jgi:hypothetical protein
MADDIPLPGETPDNVGPSSAEKSEAAKAALRDIDALYSSLIGKQKDSTREENAFLNLLSKRQAILDEISQKMVGLSGEQRAYARAEYEAIEDESKRIASVEKYFGVTKGVTKELQEQERIRKAIEKTGAALGMQTADIARLQALAAADTMLEQRQGHAAAFGEKVGRVTSTAGSALGAADAVFNFQLQNAMIGAIGKATTLMQGGNIRGGAQALSNQLFGGTGEAMGPVERMEALNKVLMNAPRAAGETSASMNKMIGTMAFFGADMDKITENLIKGNKDLNLSADNLADVYMSANAVSKNLGLSTLDTSDNLLEMYASLRQVGGSVHQAESILDSFGKTVGKTGMSASEAASLAQKFSQGISSLPIEKMMGLVQFTTGKPLQAQTAADLGNGNIIPTVLATFSKISSQMGGSYSEQLVATEKIAQMVGINVSSFRDVSNLMTQLKSGALTEHDINLLSNPAVAAAKGIEDLKATIDPLKRIANATENLQATVSTLSATITNWGLGNLMPALIGLKVGSGVVGAFGGAAKVAAATTGTGITAGLGTMEVGEIAAMGLLSAPALVATAGVAAAGAAGYYGTKYAMDKLR